MWQPKCVCNKMILLLTISVISFFHLMCVSLIKTANVKKVLNFLRCKQVLLFLIGLFPNLYFQTGSTHLQASGVAVQKKSNLVCSPSAAGKYQRTHSDFGSIHFMATLQHVGASMVDEVLRSSTLIKVEIVQCRIYFITSKTVSPGFCLK